MHTKDMLAGLGMGAALAFVLDPNRGRYRRAVLRDKMFRCSRATRNGVETTARDMRNRARGIMAATRGRFSSGDVSDEIIVERVRSRLGRASSHPRAIDVFARGGAVTLRGPILVDEVDDVLAMTRAIRGVRQVIDELDVRESGEHVPSLQGEGRVAEPMLDIMQRRWAPATRALVGASVVATGACLTAYARRHSHDRRAIGPFIS